MGYDMATRSGKALHGTSCDFHSSGAWSVLGTASIVARYKGLNHEQTRHALGIAEYYAPRSQLMRDVDYPTMVKDGSGWGAMTGVSAGLMAAEGFTGAPALTMEADDAIHYWDNLTQFWEVTTQVFKPYAVCYWGQAAIAGALGIQAENNLAIDDIKRIEVRTFHEGTRLATRRPRTTDEAQYSLPFPVAAALVHHELRFEQLNGEALNDPVVLDLVDRIEMVEDEVFNARFPKQRLARVVVETTDGAVYDSGELSPKWGINEPATDEELSGKFHELADGILPSSRARELEEAIWNVAEMEDVSKLTDLLAPGLD